MPKSPFTKKQLDEFKVLLLEKKAKIIEEIQMRSKENKEVETVTGDLVDMASELLEDEMNLMVTEQEKSHIREIDEALDRIVKNTYGICIDSGEAINPVRLKAIPEAKRSLKAQEIFDKKSHDKKKLNSSNNWAV